MIVRELTTKNGVRVLIDDAAYAGCTEEELRVRTLNAQRTAWWCWSQAHRRQREKQNAPAEASREDALPADASAFASTDMRVKHEEIITHGGGGCNGNARTTGLLGGPARGGAL